MALLPKAKNNSGKRYLNKFFVNTIIYNYTLKYLPSIARFSGSAIIKALLDVVSVRGQIVTIDAIGTQKEIAEKIRQGKGDYVLVVKDNQKILHEYNKKYFNEKTFLKAIQEQGDTGKRGNGSEATMRNGSIGRPMTYNGFLNGKNGPD